MTEQRAPETDPVPRGLRAAAGWTWRILVVALGIYALLRLLDLFRIIVVPVLVGLLLVALLLPVRRAMSRAPGRRGLPVGAASALAVVLAVAVLGGLVTIIGQQTATGFDDLQVQAVAGWQDLQRRLADSPLQLSNEQVVTAVDEAVAVLQSHFANVLTGAVAVGSTAVDVVTGFFLCLFTTYFLLADGRRVWEWVVGLFPPAARERTRGAGDRAWVTLTSYVRATVVVALVDGTGTAVVAALLGVPLALPLGVLVFLGAFVPVIGALLTGIVAVLVALVAAGPVTALGMLAGVVAVQEVEAHVLQPFLMGRAVRVHPWAVLLAIAAGVLVAGIVGGLFAVPLAAVVNVVGRYLVGAEDEPPRAGPVGEDPAGGDDGPGDGAGDAPDAGDRASAGESPAPSAG